VVPTPILIKPAGRANTTSNIIKSLSILLDFMDSPATTELIIESIKHKVINKIISLLPIIFYPSLFLIHHFRYSINFKVSMSRKNVSQNPRLIFGDLSTPARLLSGRGRQVYQGYNLLSLFPSLTGCVNKTY